MAHEDLSREHAAEGGSDRSFGLVFAGVFAVVAFVPALRGHGVRLWAIVPAAAFAVAALTRADLLAPLNRAWTRLGLMLARWVNPIALGAIYYLVITPIGLLMRRSGRDTMSRRADPAAASYWIVREPPGPPPDSMGHPF